MRNRSPTMLNLAPTCFFLLLLSGRSIVSGFQHQQASDNWRVRTTSSSTPLVLHLAKMEPEETTANRRRFLSNAVVAVSLLGLKPAGAAAATSSADGEIFKPNPLTNPVLERMRIWEQAEADELKYGGELERGDAGNKGKVDAYPRLLVPVLNIADELQTVDQLVHEKDIQWDDVQRILKQPQYQKINFKKIFNAFGDNIYYSDPDRANVYLGGGAAPSAEQSMAYLLRNEILTNVEDLQAEVNYLEQHRDEPVDDLLTYSRCATTAMQKYLAVIPPEQLRRAKELKASSN